MRYINKSFSRRRDLGRCPVQHAAGGPRPVATFALAGGVLAARRRHSRRSRRWRRSCQPARDRIRRRLWNRCRAPRRVTAPPWAATPTARVTSRGCCSTERSGTWGQGVEAPLPTNAGPNPQVFLNSVSCTSAGNCAAVGRQLDNSGGLQGLLLTETSGTWAQGVEAPVRRGRERARSCSRCRAPRRVTAPPPASISTARATSRGCWCRKSWGRGAAADGAAPLPANAGSNPEVNLNSVSCVSSNVDCGAVGTYFDSAGDKLGVLLTGSRKVTSPVSRGTGGHGPGGHGPVCGGKGEEPCASEVWSGVESITRDPRQLAGRSAVLGVVRLGGRLQRRRELCRQHGYRARVAVDGDLGDVGAGGRGGPAGKRRLERGVLNAAAYPDRIAQAYGAGRYRLRHGGGAVLAEHDPLAGADWLVAADVEGGEGGPGRADGRILLAAALDPDDVERIGGGGIRIVVRLEWDETFHDLHAVTERTLDALVLHSTSRRSASPGPDTTAALVARAIDTRLGVLGWTASSRACRPGWAGPEDALGEGWPDVSDQALVGRADDWLADALRKATSRADFARIDPSTVIRAA